MRNPLGKMLWSICLFGLGGGLVLVAVAAQARLGDTAAGILVIVGLALALIFLFTTLWALASAIGYARLKAGRHVIARWHVGVAEWDRFRAYDAVRAAEHLSLRNDVRLRQRTPPEGVDVIVGRRSIIVDGSYHAIAGQAGRGRWINWINAPVDPECIEFPKSYPRSNGGSVDTTLRVPVPAAARAEGLRVFEHIRPKDAR